MTLKKPINWGDEKVQLIILLSLDVNSKRLHQRNLWRRIGVDKRQEGDGSNIKGQEIFRNVQIDRKEL